MPERSTYCPRCGAILPEEGRCPNDGYRWFPDPKVAVGVVLEDREGRVLLVRRNHEPAYGRWAFPSGFVDAGEVLEEAALREVLEETGVEAALDRLIGAWSTPGSPVIFLAYAGHLLSGDASPGDEAFEVSWFAVDALPDLAFDHDADVVAAWQSGSGAPVRDHQQQGGESHA
ncbi:MAG: NUDIX domain-containing protein [Dehalococcoidia bacterium]